MSFFSATVAAKLAGETVRMARLIELNFADQTGRYWESGTGDLLTADGKTWTGTGSLVSISEIESALGGTAPQVKLSLSGVDPKLIPEVIAAESGVKGRQATIYLQFFTSTWATLDAPYAIFPGFMDVLSIDLSAGKADLSLTLEGLFTRRGVPPWGYLSGESQQQLFPGDTGLSEMGSMRNAKPRWPV